METLQIIRFILLLTLHWIPRITGSLFAVFVFLFSLDVFGHQEGFLKTLAAFLLHNIPTLVLIGIVVLSWKRSWIGGLSFIAMGVAYLLWMPGNERHLVLYLPLFVTGILFSLDWFLRKGIKEAREAYWGDNG